MGEGAETVGGSDAGGSRSASALLGNAWAVRRGGHRPHKMIREEDYARAKQLMRPVEDSGKRPRREAGLRYSAGRAPRGCGRFLPLMLPGSPQAVARITMDSNERTAPFRAAGARQ
jgi:hypothetical protein